MVVLDGNGIFTAEKTRSKCSWDFFSGLSFARRSFYLCMETWWIIQRAVARAFLNAPKPLVFQWKQVHQVILNLKLHIPAPNCRRHCRESASWATIAMSALPKCACHALQSKTGKDCVVWCWKTCQTWLGCLYQPIQLYNYYVVFKDWLRWSFRLNSTKTLRCHLQLETISRWFLQISATDSPWSMGLSERGKPRLCDCPHQIFWNEIAMYPGDPWNFIWIYSISWQFHL